MHPRAFGGASAQTAHGTSQSRRTLEPGAQCARSAPSRATQAHCGPAPGCASAGSPRAPRKRGARHGTAFSRVPRGPETGRAGGRTQHLQAERTNLGREGGSNCHSKVSPRLAKTVPGVETEARECPGPARPRSGERREASPGTWLRGRCRGSSGNSG